MAEDQQVKSFIQLEQEVCLLHQQLLSMGALRGQLSEQGHPDFPLPGHFLQLLREDPKAFPGQPSDIVIVLYYIIIYYIILHYNILYYIALYYIIIYYITIHYIILQYITLYYITLYYIII